MSRYNGKKYFSQPQVCERDKWSANRLCRLVCLYKKFPCLWKKDNASYMDNSTRHAAYSNIHHSMDMPQVTFTEVMIKIREVRRMYVTELQKIFKAHNAGYKYEPRERWFFMLHSFLYKYLDFDETAELHGSEDSATSRYDEDDDDESQCLGLDNSSQSHCGTDSNFEFSRIDRCRKLKPESSSCDSSQASSSTKDYFVSQTKAKCSPMRKRDSVTTRSNYRPIKVVHCRPQESTESSDNDGCHRASRPNKSTSVTVICDKKTSCRCPRDEEDHYVQRRKCSVSLEKEVRKKSESNSSLNACPGKSRDEFDVFAKSVACQLRRMDTDAAVVAQNRIQNILTDQRLQKNCKC